MRWSPGGSVSSEQRALAAAPAVAPTPEGAAELGERYWAEVERFGRGAVAVTRSADGVELRLLRRGPMLLALGPARVSASGDAVSCRYLILGGLLVRRAGGELVLSQTGRGEVELRSAIAGFFPALGRGPGRAGPLYSHVQSRIHAAAARRFFRALAQGPGA